MKNLLILLTCAAFFGCANGQWNTGNTATNAALSGATAALSTEIINAANAYAQGSDVKSALINGSGTGLNSLVGVASPVISTTLAQYVPPTPAGTQFAQGISSAIQTYVANHGNTSATLKTALTAAANILYAY